jgi:hypothetical protein
MKLAKIKNEWRITQNDVCRHLDGEFITCDLDDLLELKNLLEEVFERESQNIMADSLKNS